MTDDLEVQKLSVDDSLDDENEWCILHEKTDKLWGFATRFDSDIIKLKDVCFAKHLV